MMPEHARRGCAASVPSELYHFPFTGMMPTRNTSDDPVVCSGAVVNGGTSDGARE